MESVVQLAQQRMENTDNRPGNHENRPEQDMFNQPHPLQNELDAIDPDNMTPRQALDFIFSLKNK